MTSTAGVGLRRGRATWAERERERACAKWNGGASAGASGAQKGAGGPWAGDVARDLGVCARVHAFWSMAGRREGEADRAVPRRSEWERAHGGNSSVC
jgi:hypothetical protein